MAVRVLRYSEPVVFSDPEDDELQRALQSIEKSELTRFTEELHEKLANVDVVHELRNLKSDVLSIRKDLDGIYTAVGLLDSFNCDRNTLGRIFRRVKKFQPTWGTIREDFNNYIWDSKKMAVSVATKVQVYRTTMIPILCNPNICVKDKKLELEHFIKALEDGSDSAKKMATSFAEIPSRITQFKAEVDEALRAAGVPINQEITGLKDKIEALRKKIDKQQRMADVAAKFTLGGLGTEAAGSGLLLAFSALLGPIGLAIVMGIVFVGTAISLGEHALKRAVRDNQSELLLKQSELKVMEEKYRNFETIKAKVEAALACTESLCQRLGGIANIWSSVLADAQSMLETMNMAKGTPTEVGFKSYMLNPVTAAPYLKLEEMLFEYAKIIA